MMMPVVLMFPTRLPSLRIVIFWCLTPLHLALMMTSRALTFDLPSVGTDRQRLFWTSTFPYVTVDEQVFLLMIRR